MKGAFGRFTTIQSNRSIRSPGLHSDSGHLAMSLAMNLDTQDISSFGVMLLSRHLIYLAIYCNLIYSFGLRLWLRVVVVEKGSSKGVRGSVKEGD